MDFSNHPLVETAWLAAHLEDGDLRIVDSRCLGEGDCHQIYRAGHIPNAVHVCWHMHLSHTEHGVRYLIPPPDQFAAAMTTAGIGDETRVVAYADTDYSGAARLWWALRYYGHVQVAVLNGGLARWRAEGRPLSRDEPEPRSTSFTPHPQSHLLATADEIQRVLDDPNVEIGLVDTRPPEQYAGLAVWTPPGSLFLPPGQDWVEVAGRVMQAGHIPGAINLPSSDNLDLDTWCYLSTESLRKRAQAVGIQPQQRVITYCGCGISASLGLFALHLAGYPNLALYDASWEEWGTDPARPVEHTA